MNSSFIISFSSSIPSSLSAAATLDNNQGLAFAHQILHTSNSYSGLSSAVSASQQQQQQQAVATTSTTSNIEDMDGIAEVDRFVKIDPLLQFRPFHHGGGGGSGGGSSSTGSNSKVNSTATGANTSHTTNIVFEVHDWWSEQINIQESSDDDDDDEDDE